MGKVRVVNADAVGWVEAHASAVAAGSEEAFDAVRQLESNRQPTLWTRPMTHPHTPSTAKSHSTAKTPTPFLGFQTGVFLFWAPETGVFPFLGRSSSTCSTRPTRAPQYLVRQAFP